MKRNFLFLFYFLVSLALIGQETENSNQGFTDYFPKPKVDKRIELLSIVFRLAGNREYNSEDFKVYTNDIHNYFDKFKSHPVVLLASKLRAEKGVSYDAVMKMAFHIDQPPALTPKVEFTDDAPEKRWGKANATKFLELLRDFYVSSDFEKFYNEHLGLYSIAEERFLPVYEALNISWYNQFYGVKPSGSLNVIICLGNGGNNYGGKVIYADKSEGAYAIMGTWSFDSLDKPKYKIENYLPTLIHEFNHSYVNPLIEQYAGQLESPGKVIFEPLKENMRRQAYGIWQTMITESIVRASVIRYILKYDSYGAAKNKLISEVGNGFYWMQGLVNLLSDYENNRAKYANLESFMPTIVIFYEQVAKQSETMYEIKR